MSAKKLDELFERERSAPPPISKARTRSFVATEQELKQWTETRSKGWPQYLTFKWILGFGLPTAVLYTLFSYWFFSREIDLTRIATALIFWSGYAALRGLWTWTRMEKQYKNFLATKTGLKESADSLPETKNAGSPDAHTTKRKQIITGGIIMSIIGAIIISVSLFIPRQQDATKLEVNTAKPQTQNTTQFQKSNPASHESGTVLLQQKDKPAIQRAAAIGDDAGARQNNTGLPPATPQPTVAAGTGAPERIEPLRVYLLDAMELDRLGIHVSVDGEVEYSSLGMSESIKIENQYNVYSMELQPSIESLKKRRNIEFHVVLITDSHGNRYAYDMARSGSKTPSLEGKSYERESSGTVPRDSALQRAATYRYSVNSDEIRGVQDLIALRVNTVSLATRQYAPEDQYLLFWYEKTSELLQALPDRVSKRIDPLFVPNAEGLNSPSQKKTDATIKAKEAAKQTLPTSAGSFTMNIFPNPVQAASTTLRVTFTESRHFTVGLYDILGKKLRDVAEGSIASAQDWEQVISLDGLSAGIYLVAVTTDRGEQTVRQIIKN
jgi:hypothetical protein